MRLFEGTQFDIPPRCERCNELESDCLCPALPDPPPERIAPSSQTAKIQKEKRKKGKVVTVIRGLDEHDLPELLVKLKNACGAGGTVKDDSIEIQGDHAERIISLLSEIGYRIR